MDEPTTEPHHGLVPGAVALISTTVDDGLMPVIAVAPGDDTISVIPLSPAVQNATEWDLELPAEVLGYRAIAEVWNYGSILPEQCGELVATVTPEILEGLQTLFRAALSSDPVPNGLRVGPPVLDDDDPRLLAQDADADLAHSFWEPALALAGAATFGEFVRHRRLELDVAAAELETTSGANGWLADVEDDTLDLRQALPSHALVEVLRRLQVGASARLRAIVRSTLEGTSPQFARGRASAEPPPIDADEYLDAVFAELEQSSS
jgi:hypothetical protein